MSNTANLSGLQHCRVVEIGQEIYIAYPLAGKGAGGNAGIISMGDQTLIFDTFLTPDAAVELRQAAETLTSTPIKLVINSHHHPAHTGGNQVFDTVDIITTTATRRLMTEYAPQKLAWHKHHAQSRLAELEAAILNANGTTQRAAEQTHSQYQCLVDALPSMEVRLPNITFEQHLVIYGKERQLELITYGGGHTQSDTILYLPDDGILFMGDLLTTRNHPYLSDGDPGELPRILDIVSRLNAQQLVPGHGEVSTLTDVQAMQSYLAMLTETALTELAFQFEDESELEQKITQFAMPVAYREWERPQYFATNLYFLYQRVMTAYAD